MRIFRWVQGVSLKYHVRNKEISETATVHPITTHLMQKRLRWYGHVRRRYDSHMTRTVLAMEVAGVRPRGRSLLRCQHCLSAMNISTLSVSHEQMSTLSDSHEHVNIVCC